MNPSKETAYRLLKSWKGNDYIAGTGVIHRLGELVRPFGRRILTAAKNPSLSMKLRNMPIPMTAADVDPYMEPIIRSAMDGDLGRIQIKQEPF